jgi:glucose/arabinose dehydrogenase
MGHRSPRFALLLALIVAWGAVAPRAIAGAGDVVLATELVADELTTPVWVGSPPGDTTRLFIVERTTGLIKIVKNGVLLAQPFLDLSDKISLASENGLLGMVFHPDYANNRVFFVFHNNLDADTTLVRYATNPLDPDHALVNSGRTMLIIEQPFTQHNGSWMSFGGDGMLYLSTGDGGSGGDPFGNGQSLSTLLGKILRLDVDGGFPYAIPPDNPFVGVPGARGEIWHYGLRNPWRIGVDSLTGDMLIGDVGQQGSEELDFVAGGTPGGLNFGWDCFEGTIDTLECAGGGSFVQPIHEYSHNVGCAVVGGPAYRGTAVAGLAGTWFFADYCTGRVWSFGLDQGVMVDLTERTAELRPAFGSLGQISSFGEDANGELYIVSHQPGGRLFRVIEADPNPDCDGDGTLDADEIAGGTEFDVNLNGIPDSCEVLLTVGDLVETQVTTFEVIGAEPGQPVVFFFSMRGIVPGPCFFDGSVCLTLSFPVFLIDLGSPFFFADNLGVAGFSAMIPPNTGIPEVSFQALLLDDVDSRTSNPVQRLILSERP